ncbi:MAG: hypothetical protein J6K52_05905 [Clostridia bacterium]|nr:hypothetical protein [Clostridia bacterium]
MKIFEEGQNILTVFEKQKGNIVKKLSEYNYKQLRDFSEYDVSAIADIGVLEQVIIDFENKSYEPKRGKMKVYNHFRSVVYDKEYYEVDSIDVVVKIPVMQGEHLFRYKTNSTTYCLSYTSTEMSLCYEKENTYLTFTMQIPLSEIEKASNSQKQETLRKMYNEYTYVAKSKYDSMRQEIDKFNDSLVVFTKKTIEDIVKKDSILDAFSQAIGVELISKNAEREKGHRIIITPKKIEPSLPEKRVNNGYYFDSSNYQAILQTIREHLIATELLPKPIQELADEELIRDTILWALNSNYIIATGETFRAAGKTDICVSFEDKSAFIAECKVWRKSTTFSDALKQVYGYATWRDCKIAVLIFNLENKDFGALLKKIDAEIKNNENYISSTNKKANEWECKFKSKADSSAYITLNVFVADYCCRK